MRTRWGLVAAAVVLGGAMAGCGSDGDGGGGPQSSPSVTQAGGGSTTPGGTEAEADGPLTDTVVAASVHEPIQLIQRPGDDGHLWLAERAGRVRRLTVGDEGRTLTPAGDYVLDLSDQTTTEAERGLLGMAFSPDGGLLYVSYTDLQGDTRVVSYEMSGSDVVTSTRTVVFSQEQPFPNHNGGHIVFGPDGRLWLGLGDGGSADDPENRAQDPDTFLGKVLRIDPETQDAEIVISGVRNPWRFAFDADGSLWIGDVGQNAIEEIDRLEAGAIEGANLGWSGYEGTEPYLDGDGRRPDDAIGPVFEYSHDGGNCSITGGFVYRGEAIPRLQGAYLFADYCVGALRAIRLDEDGALEQELDLEVDVEHPVSFTEDAQGEPYVLSQDGTIVRLVPPS
ncbi:PQQ-dependent sugar dehydrogenase [Aquihabitans daechungensis]|uniref:PQQ-dependent sugar dehydrogenase n=1 Tax=Aquihabitans daechungensis TaxID=1052257 RepID=UPI003B9E5B63